MSSPLDETAARALAELVRELQRPEAYPHAPPEVGFRQTHVSLLFFAGERVYKLKKPVDLGFLDFTTLERRQRACEDEVRLNRRLAPGVYLGVVPIVRGPSGHLAVGGEGPAVEHAVEMVRLPEHRMLESMLERGEIDNARIDELARLLARFHEQAPSGPGIDEHGAPEKVAASAEENFETLERLDAEARAGGREPVLSLLQVEFLRRRSRDWLARNHELLLRRVRAGRIREGHGDLHASNVCFAEDGVVAYDCLEFSLALRCCDVASDLAFLAMDLDLRGFPAFSQALVRRYVEVSSDEELTAPLVFYKGYRAVVRAKVAALTAVDPGLSAAQREEEERRAMRYLQLAVGYELAPRVVLLCGLPASGKSWLATYLGKPLRAAVLRSDARRKSLPAQPSRSRGTDAWETGLYTPQNKERTYRALLAAALENLRAGRSVIVDATFARRAHRTLFRDALRRLDVPCQLVQVRADEATILERLARREAEGRSLSEATAAIYFRERDAFEPPDEIPASERLELEPERGFPESDVARLLDQAIALDSEGEPRTLRRESRGPTP